MSEAIQTRRRNDRVKDWLAGLALALALALLIAASIELLTSLVGLAIGDDNWHRGWVEARLKKSLDWLEELPLLGPLGTLLVDPQHGWLPGTGAARDTFVLAILAFTPCLWLGARVAPVLIARYDDEALRHAPPAELGLRWAGPLGAVQARAWEALAEWCRTGIGRGDTPFWRPFSLPDVPERFSVAVMVGENGGGKSHLVEAFARELDRSEELAAASLKPVLKAWRLKLLVKWHEIWWWRQRHPHQPWDCGYLVEDPAARSRLTAFRPRRPTLIIADEVRDATLELAVAALSANRVDFRHPVRLLAIDVALPHVLACRFDPVTREWQASAHDLGPVRIIDFSSSRFRVPQLRALIGAQPSLEAGSRTHLTGRDDEWSSVTTALDELPILLAEAIRWVRQEGRRYEDLQQKPPELAEELAARQAERVTPSLPPDMLGKSRDLLRERVLRDRARHRAERLRQALGAQAGDLGYFAVLVATIAGGGSAARLQRLLGLPSNPLTPQRLQTAFGSELSADWVPPIKPAVIADELLRQHLDTPAGAQLSADAQGQIAELLRLAWLLNPKGTRNTVARWQGRRQQDAFSKAMQTLPTLTDLESMLDAPLRLECVRAFVELTVFHDSEVALAQAALQSLQPADWLQGYNKLTAVLLSPDAAGVPALLLWLDVQRLSLPPAGSLDAKQAEELSVRLLTEALHLLRQCALVSVPVGATLEAALDEAAFATVPLLAGLGHGCVSNSVAGRLADELDWRRFGYGTSGAAGQANRLRDRLRVALVAALVEVSANDQGPLNWVPWLQAALRHLDTAAVMPPLGTVLAYLESREAPATTIARALSLWAGCQQPDSLKLAETGVTTLAELAAHHHDVAEVQRAMAIAWRHLSFANAGTDAQATEEATQRVAEIAAHFERHEAIQGEAARAWSYLAWARSNTDAQAAERAAQKAADIAARFELTEDIQDVAATAWRYVSKAYCDINARATEQTAQKAANIAARFEWHERIQLEVATAWRYLCWAHKDTDAQATEQAAQKVADIAARFERHEGIQLEAARAWRNLCWAHKDTDARATEQAVQKVADIATRFEWHVEIQLTAATAWRNLSRAHKETDARASEQAAQKVADIAARFEQREDIQLEAAEAWRNLSWVHQKTDAHATEQAAQKVADIAARFEWHEGIQREAAEAWRNLSWAYQKTDAQATEQAAQKVADIAARFERHGGIQREAAAAWSFLSWAHSDADAQATEQAAQKVADIAARFERDEAIQYQAAHAWRNLSWAHKDTDAYATEQAAQKVADIAARFQRHERIQREVATAWANTVVAAVKFDASPLVLRAMNELDKLAGVEWQLNLGSPKPASGRILEEQRRAKLAVDAWRAR